MRDRIKGRVIVVAANSLLEVYWPQDMSALRVRLRGLHSHDSKAVRFLNTGRIQVHGRYEELHLFPDDVQFVYRAYLSAHNSLLFRRCMARAYFEGFKWGAKYGPDPVSTPGYLHEQLQAMCDKGMAHGGKFRRPFQSNGTSGVFRRLRQKSNI